MIVFQTSIGINRPAEEVFAYVCDPRNLPAWNSAVQAVRPTSPATNGVGSTLDAQVELDGVAARLPQLARRAVKKGVDDNLATLKVVLEKRRRAR